MLHAELTRMDALVLAAASSSPVSKRTSPGRLNRVATTHRASGEVAGVSRVTIWLPVVLMGADQERGDAPPSTW